MALLRLSSVAKSYRRGHATIDVLRDASLNVEPGSVVSVYGARASGKTTLLRIAAGFEPPDAGDIARTSGGVAWLQSSGPLAMGLQVETFVALPLYRSLGRREAHRRAQRALTALDADEYAGESWENLPNVARALCAIAAATARQPLLLIADEPAAGLALLDRERVNRALRSLAEEDGVGVLTAVPDLPAMPRSHDTLVLSRGRLLAAAEPGEGDDNVVRLRSRRSA